jgi:hypothetical protein
MLPDNVLKEDAPAEPDYRESDAPAGVFASSFQSLPASRHSAFSAMLACLSPDRLRKTRFGACRRLSTGTAY